jgi:hypothetical protein
VFGLEVSAREMLGYSRVTKMREDKLSEQRPNADTQEREAEDAAVPAVLVCEHCRERREEYVEVAVRNRHIQRNGKADGAPSQHLRGPDDREEEEITRRKTAVEFGAKLGVSGFFAEAGSFAREDYGRVGFVHEEHGHYHKGTSLEKVRLMGDLGSEKNVYQDCN